LIASAPFGYPLDAIAVNARRREALLLGLPDPGPSAATTRTAVPQLNKQSDASGNFSFQGLAPGRYRVRVVREGYFGPPRGDGSLPDSITAVNVVAGQATPALTIALTRGGLISGTVRGASGQPLPLMTVRTYRVAYENSLAILQTAGTARPTDDRGEYRVFNLPPGEYYVAVVIGLSIGAARPQDAYTTTFYPSETDAQSARRISLKGNEVVAIDIDVRARPTAIVSGRVSNLPDFNIVGRPQSASTFFLLPADPKVLRDSSVTFLSTAPDRSNGQFEIRGIVPGAYNLMACTNDNTGRVFEGRARIDVAAVDLRDVVIHMQPAVDVQARVTVDGAAPPFTMGPPPPQNVDGPRPQNQQPIPLPSIRLSMNSLEPYAGVLRGDLPLECSTGAGSRLPSQTTFEPNGVYTFLNIPAGRHIIQVSGLPRNAYVADMRMEGASVVDGFNVANPPGEIAVTIRTNGSTVEGTVRDAQGNSAAATVVLVPQQARRNANFYKSVVSDSAGQFTVSGIAPGEYSIFAWQSVPNNAWLNADFLAPYEDRGQRLTVSPGMTAKVDIRAIR